MACTNNSNKSILLEKDSLTTIIKINDIEKRTSIKYSDIFSSVQYVQLESQKKSCIGTIDKLELTENNDIIVFDRSNCNIVRFNSDGKYLNNIGSRGHSSKEYINPELMAYDIYNKKIIVYDGAKKSLLFFNLNGSYEKSITLHKFIDDFNVVDGTALAIFANHRDALEDDEIAYNMEIINHDGKILSQYDKYAADETEFRPSPNNTFCRRKDVLYFHKYYFPTIYSVKNDIVKPLFYIDFQSKQIPKEWFACKNSDEFEHKIFSEKEKAYLSLFYESSKKYIIRATLGTGDIVNVFVDKKDLQKQKYGQIWMNDIKGIVVSSKQFFIDDKMYGIIYPEFIQNYSKVIKDPNTLEFFKTNYLKNEYEISDRDTNILKKILATNNPVIQICTLK